MLDLPQASGVLDRGGKPTVRDLLSDLVFNPADGTVRLSGERIILQRAAFSADLRAELVARLGLEDARIFLLRLGFLSGQSDARFVRTRWPKLDVSDAFTAGTRLHTFSGVVRVETVHNDFDLRRKRFSAEFLWHNSVEAAETRTSRKVAQPGCWTLIGYASGYASVFFDTLIVYKELSCAAQGHAHCRVVGKPADTWGARDPDVVLFREQVIPSRPERASATGRPPARAVDAPPDLDRIVLMPLQGELDRLAALTYPVIIAGQPGTGRGLAARHLSQGMGAGAKAIRRVFGSEITLPLCDEIADRSNGRRAAAPIVIEAPEAVPQGLEGPLARAIGDGAQGGGPRVIVVANEDWPAELAPTLRSVLSGLVVRMPPLAERAGQRADLARGLLATLAGGSTRRALRLDDGAAAVIESATWPGNLHALRSVLVGAVAEADHDVIDAGLVERHLRRLSVLARPPDTNTSRPEEMLERLMSRGDFSLAALEAGAQRIAMAQAGGNLAGAARLLGLSRAQLAYRLAERTPPKQRQR